MADSTIMSGAEVVAQLKDEQEWALKVKEMDRLCRLHLDVGYDVCQVQGHYIFVKMEPTPEKLPLKNDKGIMMPATEQVNQVRSGLVLGLGRYAFVDGPATKWTKGPLCELGEYIVFYTPEFIETTVNGYRVGVIRDPNVLFRTKKPHLFGNYAIGRSSRPREANKIIFKKEDFAAMGLTCSDPNILFREDFEEALK